MTNFSAMRLSTFLLPLLLIGCDCGGVTDPPDGEALLDSGGGGIDAGPLEDAGDVVDAGSDGGTDAGADFCSGTGPLIVPGVRGEDVCAGRLAEDVFRFALCSCSDLSTTSGLGTDSFDSAVGTATMDGGGSVGVNGSMATTNGSDIGGALWVSGMFRSTAPTTVHTDMHVGGDILGRAAVGGRAFVGGNISSPDYAVTGQLTIPTASNEGSATYGSIVRAPVTVEDQCRCDEASIPDIAGFVTRHATDNDNASIPITPTVLVQDQTALTLPCGRYYLTGMSATAGITIHVQGRVALFVDGNIQLNTGLTVDFTDEGELDLFVTGNVSSTGGIRLGDAAHPSRSRMYVAGTLVQFTAESTVVGNIYAPRAMVSTTGGIELFGSLVAGEFSSTSRSTVHYDRDILTVGEMCDPPPSTCSMCGDCDSSEACIGGACTTCTEDSDCCPPLICGSSGACEPLLI